MLVLAEAHVVALKLLLYRREESLFKIFNLVKGKGYSVLEIISIFEKITNQKFNNTITDRRPDDISELYANIILSKEKQDYLQKEI